MLVPRSQTLAQDLDVHFKYEVLSCANAKYSSVFHEKLLSLFSNDLCALTRSFSPFRRPLFSRSFVPSSLALRQAASPTRLPGVAVALVAGAPYRRRSGVLLCALDDALEPGYRNALRQPLWRDQEEFEETFAEAHALEASRARSAPR